MRNAQSFIVESIAGVATPGAIQFAQRYGDASGQVVGFTHTCPCGCGKHSFIRLNPEAWEPATAPIWERTGDDLHMTITPSIGIHPIEGGAYHWHGFLRNGVFEEC